MYFLGAGPSLFFLCYFLGGDCFLCCSEYNPVVLISF